MCEVKSAKNIQTWILISKIPYFLEYRIQTLKTEFIFASTKRTRTTAWSLYIAVAVMCYLEVLIM